MTGPTSVDLTISGVLNGRPFGARGRLRVDSCTGTKDGTITYSTPPAGVTVGPDSTIASTGRCFVGARPSGAARMNGPMKLLGREFVSLRVTSLGRYGNVSISERARITRGVLRSELTALGEYRIPVVRGMGPLRETIRVEGDGTLVSSGRYTLLRPHGRPIHVRYLHFYHPTNPDRRLFGRWRGRTFVLRASISVRVRGRTLVYHSGSTISPPR